MRLNMAKYDCFTEFRTCLTEFRPYLPVFRTCLTEFRTCFTEFMDLGIHARYSTKASYIKKT